MVNFSIIIPTYNRTHLINRSVNSALENIVEGDEILVIDDGSKEDYSDALKEYDPLIVKYSKISNGGVSAARNHGLDIAQNDYIAFLDDDDEWYNNHLHSHRSVYTQKLDIAGVFCNFDNTTKEGEILANGIARWSEGMPQIKDLLVNVIINNMPNNTQVYIGDHYKNQLSTDYILPSSFSFNRKICGITDRFYLGLNRNQTWLFNSHICSYAPVAYIDDITCIQHGDAEIRNTGIAYFETIMSRLFVMSKEWGSNQIFCRDNSKLYDDTHFQDFFSALKISIRQLSINKLYRLIKLVGPINFIRYSMRSVYYFIKPGKSNVRIT